MVGYCWCGAPCACEPAWAVLWAASTATWWTGYTGNERRVFFPRTGTTVMVVPLPPAMSMAALHRKGESSHARPNQNHRSDERERTNKIGHKKEHGAHVETTSHGDAIASVPQTSPVWRFHAQEGEARACEFRGVYHKLEEGVHDVREGLRGVCRQRQ